MSQKPIKLRVVETGWSLDRQTRAGIMVDDDAERLIMLQMPEAKLIAHQIAIAVNFYDPMLSVLSMFSSAEMGGPLLALLETNNMPINAIENVKKLINAIDVILKGIEIRTKGISRMDDSNG